MKGKMVNRRVLIEGLVLVGMSLVSLAESTRLLFYTDPIQLVDWLGPGKYLFLVSMGLLASGISYICNHLRDERGRAEEGISKEKRIRLIGAFVSAVIYIILVDVLGYGMATFIFFVLIFKVVGIESWPFNILLSIVFGSAFYFVFVRAFNVVFPRGILF